MPKTLLQIRLAQRANAASYHARMKDNPEYKRKKNENYNRWKVKRQLEKETTE